MLDLNGVYPWGASVPASKLTIAKWWESVTKVALLLGLGAWLGTIGVGNRILQINASGKSAALAGCYALLVVNSVALALCWVFYRRSAEEGWPYTRLISFDILDVAGYRRSSSVGLLVLHFLGRQGLPVLMYGWFLDRVLQAKLYISSRNEVIDGWGLFWPFGLRCDIPAICSNEYRFESLEGWNFYPVIVPTIFVLFGFVHVVLVCYIAGRTALPCVLPTSSRSTMLGSRPVILAIASIIACLLTILILPSGSGQASPDLVLQSKLLEAVGGAPTEFAKAIREEIRPLIRGTDTKTDEQRAASARCALGLGQRLLDGSPERLAILVETVMGAYPRILKREGDCAFADLRALGWAGGNKGLYCKKLALPPNSALPSLSEEGGCDTPSGKAPYRPPGYCYGDVPAGCTPSGELRRQFCSALDSQELRSDVEASGQVVAPWGLGSVAIAAEQPSTNTPSIRQALGAALNELESSEVPLEDGIGKLQIALKDGGCTRSVTRDALANQ